MKKLITYVACALPLLFGGFAAANAQLTEIGSGTGVDISYTGPTLTLTGSNGSYSTHNGSSVGTTYGNAVETFTSSATGTSTFDGTGSPTSAGGESFGGGTFTITDGGTTLLSGTFTGSTLSEGSLGGNDDGEFLMSGISYTGTAFPTGFSPDAAANDGSLTFNYTPGINGAFNTSDASAYYAVKGGSAVPELSPVAILGIGSLALFGMLFMQGRNRRTSRVAL